MSDLQELKDALQEKGAAWGEHKKTVDAAIAELKKGGDKISGETEEKLRKIDEGIQTANTQKKAMEERLGLLETAVQRGAVSGKDEGKSEAKEVTEYKAAFWKALQSGHLSRDTKNEDLMDLATKAEDADPQFKALARQSEADGGYRVPADMSGQMVTVLRETSPMRTVSSVQAISSADALEGLADTQQATFEWVNETESRSETGTTQWKKWRINVHEMAARILVSQQLIEDAEFDPEAWAMEKAQDVFIRGENSAFINGNGDNKPRGIITYPHSAPNAKDPTDPESEIQPWGTMERIPTGVASDLTDPEPLMELQYALKTPYRANARYMFNNEGFFKIRLIKDGEDRFIWQPGLQAGQPDMILGFPTIDMPDLPSFADGAVIGGFGDFRRTYQVVDRIAMSLIRDPFSVKPFVELYMRRRVGGDVINFDTMKLLESSVAVA